jgi:hypothetical protein
MSEWTWHQNGARRALCRFAGLRKKDFFPPAAIFFFGSINFAAFGRLAWARNAI